MSEAARALVATLRNQKIMILGPAPVGRIDQLRRASAFHELAHARLHDADKYHPAFSVTPADDGSPFEAIKNPVEVLSDLGVPRFLRDPAFLPDELPFGLGRLSVGPVDIAPTIWYSALDPLPALAQRAGRVSRKIIEFAAGRLAGLTRHDARHWRRLLRDFFVRTFARVGRAASSSPPTPNDMVDLLPLRSALTPTAPPAAAS
jgi:hypothetical protein